MSTSQYIRPMEFREMIGAMFKLYRKVAIPIIILNIIMPIVGLVLGSLSIVLIQPTLIIVSNVILGKPPKIMDSIRRGVFTRSCFTAFFAGIVWICILAFLPFLASLYFSLTEDIWMISFLIVVFFAFINPVTSFPSMIILLEKKSFRDAIRRSWHIVFEGQQGSRIVQYNLFVAVVFGIIALIIGGILGISEGGGIGETIVGVFTLLYFLSYFFGGLTYPYVFLYYQYRARYENYTEELLAQELGYEVSTELLTT